MQRALSASEPTAHPVKSNSAANKISPSAVNPKISSLNQAENLKKELSPPKKGTAVDDELQKKSFTPDSPQKTKPTPVTLPDKVDNGPQNETQSSPTPVQKTPLDIMGSLGSRKPTVQASPPKLKEITVPQDKPQETKNLSKSRPDFSKTTESMTGKMFGFGSSIFSSASTLITAAVQEESRTNLPGSRKMSAPAHVSPKFSATPKISPKSTPPVSPKMSPARELKPKKTEPVKKPEEPHQSKRENAGEACCPLCKVQFNISSKDPPNYSRCTECKITVCTQCGFNPMPIGEVSLGIQKSALL